MKQRQLFLDCDGVLADFERGARALLGMSVEEFQQEHGVGTDDLLKHRHLWEGAGGIFIHHRTAADTLRHLSKYFDLDAHRVSSR